ncbi:MAG TPA: ion transporter [Candidatus Poseidoniia archaeon]|nr:ion transporter [Candidatus Poseidoniia archaeon]
MTQKDTVDDLLADINRIKYSNLSYDTLMNLEKEITEEKNELIEELKNIKKSIYEDLENNNASKIDEKKSKARIIKNRLDNTENRLEYLNNQTETKYMEDNFKKFLGSQRKFEFYEQILMYVIISILGLIVFDLLINKDDIVSMYIFYIDVVCCIYFLSDLTLRYKFSRNKKWFWNTYWLDILTSIPVPPTGQIIRAGRFIRLLRILRMTRIFRVFLFMWRGMEKLQDVINVPLLKKSLKLALTMVIVGAIVITWAEGTSNNSVGNIFDSSWWSFISIFTGAFGPIYNPSTAIGRVMTVILVISGMLLVGIFTATLTSLYIDDETDELAYNQADLSKRLERIEELLKK